MATAVFEESHSSPKKVKWTWTSGAGGTVTKETTEAYSGVIERLVTVPGTAGDQPDDNYNVVINDQDDTDVLMGAGATRDELVTEQVLASSLGCMASDKLTLSIDSAGNAKSGTVYLYIR